MIDSKVFSTRTTFIQKKNATVKGIWGIALDIGYSGVKGMSPNSIYCFPSFARKLTGQMLNMGEAQEDEILYKDENGELWNVGALAQDMLTSDDTNDSELSLYGRHRYYTPMFLVLVRTGIAAGMKGNECRRFVRGELKVQTGLPPAYLRSDAPELKEAMSGHHSFSVKFGNDEWQKYEFDLTPEDIKVMAQPMGSLLSVYRKNTSEYINDIAEMMKSNVLIFDAGFGTVDTYSACNRRITASESYDDCGMKAVMQDLSEKIFKNYGKDIPVHAMQTVLKDGYFKKYNRKSRSTEKIKIGDMLEDSSRKICRRALEQIDANYNGLQNYDYLLVTGGTGAAWLKYIEEYYSQMDDLSVITGSRDNSLPMIFSNVRGYYLHQVAQLKKNEAQN